MTRRGAGVTLGIAHQRSPDPAAPQPAGATCHQERGDPVPFDAPRAHDLAAAELGSIISDDSSTASNCAAGTVFNSVSRLSGQAASCVPLKNQLLPLSARIRPECCIARRMTCV